MTRLPPRTYRYLTSPSFSTSSASSPVSSRTSRCAASAGDSSPSGGPWAARGSPSRTRTTATSWPPVHVAHDHAARGELADHSSSLTSGTKRTAATASSRAVADPDQVLAPPARDRADQRGARRELLEQRRRRLVPGGRGHRDAPERGAVGRAASAVADAHLDVVVAELGERLGRDLGEALVALDGHHLRAQARQHRGRVPGPGADLEHASRRRAAPAAGTCTRRSRAARSSGPRRSAARRRGRRAGADPAARSAPAGPRAIAASTRSSWIPRRRSWRSTMRARASVDVVAEPSRVMHGHFSPSQGDHPGALQRGEEAARALARGAGQVRDLGLRRPDQDVLLGRALGLARDGLRQQRAGDPAGDRLERLLQQPLVGAADALGERGEQLQREVRVALDRVAGRRRPAAPPRCRARSPRRSPSGSLRGTSPARRTGRRRAARRARPCGRPGARG